VNSEGRVATLYLPSLVTGRESSPKALTIGMFAAAVESRAREGIDQEEVTGVKPLGS
jgi:hypothetical protein